MDEAKTPTEPAAMDSEKMIKIDSIGAMDTLEYRLLAKKADDRCISLWHDIKLYPFDGAKDRNIVNMVNEIPRCTRKKYEIATNEINNPIKQDVKKGKLREFLKGDLYFNYGCLPRTWEDPDTEHPDAKARGDNDPLDVCEIGMRILKVGEVCSVKILGTLCLIDEGEADWKMVAISTSDPWCELLNDIDDLEEKLPGTVNSIREWFRTYKIPDGKPENKFGLEGRCMNAAYAMGVVHETHEAWRNLVLGLKDDVDAGFNDVEGTAGEEQKNLSGSGMKRNLSYPKLSEVDLSAMEPQAH
jgi:inorganic pyrophosphatase